MISHPSRLLWPVAGVSKLDLAHYWSRIGAHALPHVLGRPLTLFHCARGVGGPCAFLRHAKTWGPSALRRVHIREKTKIGEYLVVEDVAGLVALAQMDVVEVHTWNVRAGDLERPDRLVFDLDPGPGVSFAEVVRAAFELRDALDALGLPSFAKTTGGVGVHVVVPLVPRADVEACLAFARALAATLARRVPSRWTDSSAKSRRAGRIYLDWLRNNRTNTSVAAFSPRARATPTISVPVSWGELRTLGDPGVFTLARVVRRLGARRVDPWARYERSAVPLDPDVARAVERVAG